MTTLEDAVKEDVKRSLSDWAMYFYRIGYEDAESKIVYCKDCKYSVDEYDDGECYCDYEKDLRYIKDWDHYCSWAEGKEG